MDDEPLYWRRIHPDWIKVDKVTGSPVIDDTGEPVLTSQAFQNKDKRSMSCHCVKTAEENGISPDQIIEQFPGYGLIEIPGSVIKMTNQTVELVTENGDITHAHIIGEKPKSVRREFAKHFKWVILPRLQ